MELSPRQPRLLCFSHLRWGFVWQRPQHLMTRFSKQFEVTFIEEPEFVPDADAGLRTAHDGGVTILTPLLAASAGFPWGFNDRTNREIKRLLASRSFGVSSSNDVVWHYTPMSLGAAPGAFDQALVIFDAMDELANFRGAPADLAKRERALLREAALVFAGGPSLYEERRDAHPRVFCFPSGVDASHFQPDPSRLPPADSAAWKRPVLGFYGVLDERVDFGLIAGLADRMPSWTVAMIGPLAKITEADLPRRPNIVYPGKRDYRDLPAYLDCFDVAFLPFALNDATRFISPTKTLEYLAAGKPVISTPIRDVIDLYGDAVTIAATADEFAAAAIAMLKAPAAARRGVAADLVAAHDWDRIADEMLRQIALANRAEPALSLAI